MNGNRIVQDIQKREDNEHLMSAVIGIMPALGDRWIEKIRHQPVGLTCHGRLFFEYARSLKFSEALQFIAGETLQKFQNEMTMRGICGTKESADH
jgi:hypothetical protein